MGVAMHQQVHARVAEDGFDGARVDVHDFLRLHLVGGLAFAARLLGHGQAFRNGLGQEGGLPLRIAHHGAELLVRGVVGTEFVAVGQQHRAVVCFQQGRFRQQLGADRGRQFLAHEEIAVAAPQPDRNAGGRLAQRLQHRRQPGRGDADRVVADPGVEDVARQQQRARFLARGLQKGQEGLGRGRRGRPQVQIRGQPDRAGQGDLIQELRPSR